MTIREFLKTLLLIISNVILAKKIEASYQKNFKNEIKMKNLAIEEISKVKNLSIAKISNFSSAINLAFSLFIFFFFLALRKRKQNQK